MMIFVLIFLILNIKNSFFYIKILFIGNMLVIKIKLFLFLLYKAALRSTVHLSVVQPAIGFI